MSIHRRAAKRDANEPVIMKRFRTHGWHVEQLSGTGMPDLLCWPRQAATPCHKVERCLSLSVLVDVKMPDGKPTKAQVSKWTYLRLQGIPVYVARTVEDVDAIVGGTAAPWGVMEAKQKKGKVTTGTIRAPRAHGDDRRLEAELDAANTAVERERKRRAPGIVPPKEKLMGMGHALPREPSRCRGCKKVVPPWAAGMCSDCKAGHMPPRSTPPDAAKEAEAFAPPRLSGVSTGRPVSIVLSCRGINTEVTGMNDEEVAAQVAQLVNAPPPPRLACWFASRDGYACNPGECARNERCKEEP